MKMIVFVDAENNDNHNIKIIYEDSIYINVSIKPNQKIILQYK